MPKAVSKSTTHTRRANPDDAELFEMIEHCAAIWRECGRLDETGVDPTRERCPNSNSEVS